MKRILAVYGTFREGYQLSGYLREMRKLGEIETLDLPGLKMFVMGEAPGIKITNDPRDKAVIELIGVDLDDDVWRDALRELDIVEGVSQGLYERSYIDTPRGEAVIYTWTDKVPESAAHITDWAEWDAMPEEEKEKLRGEGGIILV